MVKYRIMPADGSTDLSKVEAEIRAKADVKKVEKEPIAFGLVALNVTVFMMDAEGESDKVEAEISKIEGVGGVEVLEMGRLM